MRKKFLQPLLIITCFTQGGIFDRAHATFDPFECVDVRTSVQGTHNAVGWFVAEVGPSVGIPTRSGKNFKFLLAHPTTAPDLPKEFSTYKVIPVPPSCALGRNRLHWQLAAVNPNDLR